MLVGLSGNSAIFRADLEATRGPMEEKADGDGGGEGRVEKREEY